MSTTNGTGRGTSGPYANVWHLFCDELKHLGDEVLGRAPSGNELDEVEGYRYLTRLLRSSLERHLEGDDPLRPRLEPAYAHRVSFAQRNPDQLYLSASVRAEHEYRICGRLGTASYLSFSTRSSGYFGSEGMTGTLDQARLLVDDHNRFEILVSAQPKKGNWLPMRSETDSLLIREAFFDDNDAQPSEMVIERLGPPVPPPMLERSAFEEALFSATISIFDLLSRYGERSTLCAKQPNRLIPQDELLGPGGIVRQGGDPNITYYLGYWSLSSEDALLIETRPPACAWWGFQLMNWWQESLNLPLSSSHVNKQTADYLADGSVRLVVSASDIGAGNWIDPHGHRHGMMLFRWIGAAEPITPQVRVIPMAELPLLDRFSDKRLNRIGAGYRVTRIG